MISVIIPVFNENNSILETLQKINTELSGTFKDFEIIVVDDGSTDGSALEISKASIPVLSVITHVENMGYGKSLFDGIVMARYECIAIIDADGSYPENQIAALYHYFPAYDMIVGARKGTEYKKGLLKRPARYLFSALVTYATGRKVPDVNSGLRLFKKELVVQFKDSLCTGFSFTTTITMLFLLNHYYVKYIEIEYLKRCGKSKVKHFKDTLRAGQIIIQAFVHYNPIKLFLLLASANLALGVCIGAINLIVFHNSSLWILSALSALMFIPISSLGLIADHMRRFYVVLKNSTR